MGAKILILFEINNILIFTSLPFKELIINIYYRRQIVNFTIQENYQLFQLKIHKQSGLTFHHCPNSLPLHYATTINLSKTADSGNESDAAIHL